MSSPTRPTLALVLVVAAVVHGNAAAQPAAVPSDWKRVERLEPGTEMSVTSRSQNQVRYWKAFAEPLRLVVLRFPGGKLPRRVVQALRVAESHWPEMLAGGPTYRVDSVEVSREGIFEDTAKMADVIEVDRTDILEVRRTMRVGSTVGAIVGTCVGAAVGAGAVVHFAFKPCNGSCGDEQSAMLGSIFGFPVAGGLIGWYRGGEEKHPVTIYRAPAPGPARLDDELWGRIRAALPRSLRGDGAN